jgi:hypothetical protein
MDREAGKKTTEQAKTHTVVALSAEKLFQQRDVACLEVWHTHEST